MSSDLMFRNEDIVPTYGRYNPERSINGFWRFMIEQNWSAMEARSKLNLSGSLGPVWSFSRYGETRTLLSHDKTLFLAGSHEDSSDPDWWIYNDAIVVGLHGEIEIFTYPPDCFPGVYAHTANLIGDTLYIVGGKRLSSYSCSSQTSAYKLDVKTFRIEQLATAGESPGAISDHHAKLSSTADQLLVSGGRVVNTGDPNGLYWLNYDMYSLDVQSCTWEKLVDCDHLQFVLSRTDNLMLHPRALSSVLELPIFSHPVDDSNVDSYLYRCLVGGEFICVFWRVWDVSIVIEGAFNASTLVPVIAAARKRLEESLNCRIRIQSTSSRGFGIDKDREGVAVAHFDSFEG